MDTFSGSIYMLRWFFLDGGIYQDQNFVCLRQNENWALSSNLGYKTRLEFGYKTRFGEGTVFLG